MLNYRRETLIGLINIIVCQCTTSSGAIDTRDQSLVDGPKAGERTIWGDTKTTTAAADKKRPSQGSNTPAIRKRIGTITIVFVTLLLRSSRRNEVKIEEKRSAPATEEDVKSTGKSIISILIYAPTIVSKLKTEREFNSIPPLLSKTRDTLTERHSLAVDR